MWAALTNCEPTAGLGVTSRTRLHAACCCMAGHGAHVPVRPRRWLPPKPGTPRPRPAAAVLSVLAFFALRPGKGWLRRSRRAAPQAEEGQRGEVSSEESFKLKPAQAPIVATVVDSPAPVPALAGRQRLPLSYASTGLGSLLHFQGRRCGGRAYRIKQGSAPQQNVHVVKRACLPPSLPASDFTPHPSPAPLTQPLLPPPRLPPHLHSHLHRRLCARQPQRRAVQQRARLGGAACRRGRMVRARLREQAAGCGQW